MDEKSGISATTTEDNAIYYDVSPKLVLLTRFINVICMLMVLISFVLCLIKGHNNSSNYLLACNIIISSLVCIVVNYWYRSGDLGPEKFWYIILVGLVIIFQSLTTDIYVFQSVSTAITTTFAPNTTRITPVTFSNVTNKTAFYLTSPATTPLAVYPLPSP